MFIVFCLMQVTAAHCVYDINDSHQYVANLNFAPGEADENTLPYGSVQWSSVRVLSQFTNQVSECSTCCVFIYSAVWCAASCWFISLKS